MKKNKLLISVLTLFLASTLISIENKDTILNVSTTSDKTLGHLNISRHNVIVGSDDTIAYSPTYVQHGKDTQNYDMLRFVTAIKGNINSLTYTLNYQGLTSPFVKEVTTVYNAVSNGTDYLYYNGHSLTTEKCDDYYFACLTIKYTTQNKEDLKLTASLNINGSINLDSKTTSLNEVKENKTDYIIDNIASYDYFDDENIALSFGAISDTHLDATSSTPTTLLDNVIDSLITLNNNQPLDGIVIGGDLADKTYQTSGRTLSDFAVFANYMQTNIDPNETTLFYTMGNHDIDPTQTRGSDCENVPQYYYEDLGHSFFQDDVNYQDYLNGTKVTGNRHAIINGYHFISVSPKYFWIKDSAFTNETITWLENTLADIAAENTNKPIFVISHSAIANTVRLSDDESNTYGDLENVLKDYPQVIYMAGHIHNLISDELSIEQRDFTMIDLGSTKYSSSFNSMYSNGYTWNQNLGGTTYENNIGSLMIGSGCYIQVDIHGNVKITRVMVNEDKSLSGVIEEPWIISAPVADKTHLMKYNDTYRIKHNKAPYFDASAKIIPTYVKTNTTTSVNVAISGANDDKYVEYFQVSLKTLYGKTIKTKYYQTHYYNYLLNKQMPDLFNYDFGVVSKGTYILEVKAGDVWQATSEPLSTVITIN